MNIINYTITFDYYEENNSLFYFYLLLVVFLATVLLGLAFLISTLKKSNTLSRTEGLGVYEFGATTIGSSSSSSTNKHYYVLAVLFIIFDVELMILYPFGIAVSDNRLHLGGLILFFLFLLMVGYSYEMVSGALS